METISQTPPARTGRRGRPRMLKLDQDHGTPELRAKRAAGVTAEALDWCLHEGILSPEQHRAGIRLRWLHTLRFGSMGVTAYDPTAPKGAYEPEDTPEWRAAREQEYHHAIQLLRAEGCLAAALNVCVYEQRPSIYTRASLRDGLGCLAGIWSVASGRRTPLIGEERRL